MPPILRQLVAPIVLTVALATGAMAQTDSITVVTFGPDGFSLQAPDDVPVGEGKAVMLRRMGENGWAMTTLKPGDVPSEVAETVGVSRLQFSGHNFPRPLSETHRARSYSTSRPARERLRLRSTHPAGDMFEIVETEPQRSVLFEVTARLGDLEMDNELVSQLSENEALRRLEVSEDLNSGTVEAQFMFDSVEEWNTWKATPETVQMLDALRETTRQMQTRMEVRQ